MNYLISYENFSESKGISDSCEKILHKIWKEIGSQIKNSKSGKIELDINEDDFKCKGVSIIFDVKIGDENLCNAQTILNNSKFIDDYLTSVELKLDILFSEFDEEFVYYIKSVLFHELLHVFQHYNIVSKNKFRPESFSIGSILPQLRKIVKTKYAQHLLDVLYYSLSHELSAQLHQYYFYKISGKEYKKIFDIQDFLKRFEIARLSNEETIEVNFIKKHIFESIKFYTKNVKYSKKIEISLWNENDSYIFLNKLKKVIDSKVKWMSKKISLVNKKIEDGKIIRYDENYTLPHDWKLYDKTEKNNFIIKNLSDLKYINFI